MKYILLTLLLTSCATPQIKPDIPISVSCIKEYPVKPEFKSHDYLNLLPNPDYVTQITIELLKHESYEGELEGVLQGCK